MSDLKTVVDWITEAHGEQVAHDWLWGCTPYPAGEPTAKMLTDGLRLAFGELLLPELMVNVVAEMAAAMAA